MCPRLDQAWLVHRTEAPVLPPLAQATVAGSTLSPSLSLLQVQSCRLCSFPTAGPSRLSLTCPTPPHPPTCRHSRTCPGWVLTPGSASCDSTGAGCSGTLLPRWTQCSPQGQERCHIPLQGPGSVAIWPLPRGLPVSLWPAEAASIGVHTPCHPLFSHGCMCAVQLPKDKTSLPALLEEHLLS